MDLNKLFRPKKLAIIGGYWADFVYDENKKIGFKGKIWHINPKRSTTKKKKYFKSLADLPSIPDCVYIAVSNDLTIKLMTDIADMGAGGAVCLASRFSELNTLEGKEKTKKLIANSGKTPFLGPNCYGFINYFDRVSVWSDQVAGNQTNKGVAIICQSGTIGNTISFNHRSLPIGYIISLGNQAKLGIEDTIEYALKDKRVTAIGIYAEGFTNINKLIRVLKISKEKKIPIAIVKVGRSKVASETILTHTGSLSGKENIYDALFKRMGVARCETLSELTELLKYFHTHGVISNDQISIMGPSGGDMAMLGDAAETLNLKFGKIKPKIRDDLKKVNHPGIIVSNPFDMQTYNWNDPDNIEKTFKIFFKNNFSSISLMLDFPNMEKCDTDEWDAIVNKFIKIAKKYKNGSLISSLSDTMPKHIRDKCINNGISPLQGMKEALFTIKKAIEIGSIWKNESAVKNYKVKRKNKNIKTYSEFESKKILKKIGIRIPKGIISDKIKLKIDSAKIGFPLVAKIHSNTIFHKSEHNGVKTNIKNFNELISKTKTFKNQILLEKMVKDSLTEILIGIKIDDEFGPVIVIGAGGIYTELIRETKTLLLPLTKKDIHNELKNMKIGKILFGYRNQDRADIDSLIKTILSLSKFAEKNINKLHEIEINPLLVCKKNKGVFAVDALIHYFEEL
ncbi:acetate--CoA ligase family protein [Alphaproteobacteria bacterium]|nr:acetate--CoA ligase family protein [Pelagibacteraceae bacterium]MDC3270054.1 acetate--CoA ligase family protein [Alphaproteobacteria bacterium]